jgi:hypothetical protein
MSEGFGERKDEFRFWIDQDILNKSYCRSEDSSFESGALAEVPNLKVACVSIYRVL